MFLRFGKRLTVLFLILWSGIAPAWSEEEVPEDVSCEELFRRTMREELGKGDEVWIIYRDGHTVRGRFMGFVKESPEFLVAPGEGGLEASEAYPLSLMQTLRYRRLASDGPNIFFGTIFVGAVAGFFAGFLVGAMQDPPSGEGAIGYGFIPFAGALVGALAGLGVGMVLPRLIVPAKTIECGPLPVYDGAEASETTRP